jgi:hypothetical protein
VKLITDPFSKLLVVNPYAGGILTAALEKDFEVVTAYVDVEDGFGLNTAILNHDYATFVFGHPKDWGLAVGMGRVVIANNPSNEILRWMGYQRPGAMIVSRRMASRSVDENIEFGLSFNYHYYQIQYNTATFNLPQWRDGVLDIFIWRQARDDFVVHHTPTKSTVDSLLDDHSVYDGGVSDGYRPLAGNFVAPQLTPNYGWSINGRVLTSVEYKRAAGYPDDYMFSEGYNNARMRAELSRGIAPPVAMWALDLVERNLHHPRSFHKVGRGANLRESAFWLVPFNGAGHGTKVVADLRPTLKLWYQWGEEDDSKVV